MAAPLLPLETHHDATEGPEVPLPAEIAALYGTLRLPAPDDRPYVTSNFVSTLDGVVALGEPGTGGDEISGGSREDRFVMGVLRAAADAIVVGAGTLRAFPRHVWTPEAIYAPMKAAFTELRRAAGKPEAALTAIVTATGDVDLTLPVFTGGGVVITTEEGARRMGNGPRIRVAGRGDSLRASDILKALAMPAGAHVLLECGPQLMGRFVEDRAVDELFLTVAPQVAGREPGKERDGFVSRALFLPRSPRWAQLASLKRCADVLFLRYRFR
jgi:riboflavin biosynthesis pyrimidine reductase